MRITVFGAGAYGHALSRVLLENHHQITFYDPHKFPSIALEKAVENPEALIMAAPSITVENLLSSLPSYTHALPLVCASKGFLSLRPFANFPNLSVLGGPTFAVDLEARHPSILTASSDFAVKLFSTPWLKIEQIADPLGILLCGSLKNVYAIEAGYRELTPTNEEFISFVSKAHAELKLILETNHCSPTTTDHACGLADLTMTCASNKSRNYQFGQVLRSNPHAQPSQTTEGLSAVANISNTPSVIIPEEATILHSIVTKIKQI